MTEHSVVAGLRSGRWRELSGGPLAVLATAAVALDVTTTAYIFSSPSFAEANVLLARVEAIAPALALAVFVGYCLAHLAVVWLSFGWLSDVVAIFLVAVMGVGGLNNLLLFATGSGLYPLLGLPTDLTVHLLKPVLAVALGLAVARQRGPLPWPEVTVLVTPGPVLGLLLFLSL